MIISLPHLSATQILVILTTWKLTKPRSQFYSIGVKKIRRPFAPKMCTPNASSFAFITVSNFQSFASVSLLALHWSDWRFRCSQVKATLAANSQKTQVYTMKDQHEKNRTGCLFGPLRTWNINADHPLGYHHISCKCTILWFRKREYDVQRVCVLWTLAVPFAASLNYV